MKKTVLKLELQDGKGKQKAMKTVSTLSGIDSIAIDMKQKKMTVTGDIDPVTLVAKLRKLYQTEIVTFGPAKEPEKKKEEPKKTDDKKDPKDYWAEFVKPPQVYDQPPPFQTHHFDDSAEEDTNPCAIC